MKIIRVNKLYKSQITELIFMFFFICNSFAFSAQIKEANVKKKYKLLEKNTLQKDSISLKFKDSINKKDFFGIQVVLKNTAGNIIQQGLTNKNGRITFLNLENKKSYFLNYSGLGYKNKLEIEIKPKNKIQILILETSHYQLNEIIIKSKYERFKIRGDTTSFNADLYASKTDLNAGNIIEKLPGTILKDGKLLVNGDKVNTILLDGKTYIKANISATLEQIPSEIISRIEIIDNVSIVDPAQQIKTVNIITKTKNNLTFGKLVSNYGSKERNRIAGNYFLKTKNNRLTTIVDANNINKEDIITNEIASLYEGNNSLLAGGLNYQYQAENDKTTLEFNLISNDLQRNLNNTFNQYLIAFPKNGPILKTTSNKKVNESITNFDVLFTNNFSSNLYLSLASKGSNLTISANDDFKDLRLLNGATLYDLNLKTLTKQNTLLFENNATIIKNFVRTSSSLVKGREISLMLNYNIKKEEQKDTLTYFYSDKPLANLFQIRNEKNPIKNKSIKLEVNEKWNKNYLLTYNLFADIASVNYEILTTKFDNDNFLSGILDTSLSSINQISHQKFGGSIKIIKTTKQTQTTFGLNYKKLKIESNLTFPNKIYFNSSYHNVLPFVSFVFKNKKSSRFKMVFKTLQESPQFSHLNPITNNSIPSRIFIGKTDLKPEIKYVFDIEYKTKGAFDIHHRFKLNSTKINDFIGESIFLPQKDSIVNGFTIKEGIQLIQPKNFNHLISNNISFSHERNTKKFKYGLNYGFRYDLIPNSQNNKNSKTSIKRFNSGIYWNYYPTNKLSLNFNYYGSYAEIQNTMSLGHKQSMLNWNAGISIKYFIFNSLLLDFESNSFQAKAFNIAAANNRITSVLNFSAKQTLFRKKNISILFKIHDLLNQNRDITQNPTALYFTQEQKTMLGRYFLLGFSFNL